MELWEEAEQGRENGGNGGDRHVCGAVMALAGMARRLSVFEGGEEEDVPSALGGAGGGRCWGL